MPEPAAAQFADLLRQQLDEMHRLGTELAAPPFGTPLQLGGAPRRPASEIESDMLAAVAGTVVLLARWAIELDEHWAPERERQRQAVEREHAKIRELFGLDACTVPPDQLQRLKGSASGTDAVTFLEPTTPEGE